ncbi:hypothetical protein HYC85_000704 [Camellia sinensis]|uniref:Peptidase M1 leukotriene A4 hydrolase/aminopeptidase C-terminal domain-containing protein n=1 Tax=Camellia sinensis TaxID=4442 RepID=A0A7J7I3Z9_CAMSI|nr:hypothetical protein HYC85_000704 [Camellia sinensis]
MLSLVFRIAVSDSKTNLSFSLPLVLQWRLSIHTRSESSHPLATHISLSLFFDFSSSTIHSSALLSLPTPHSGPISLDTRSLSITSVFDPLTKTPLPFSLSSPSDPIKGQSLTISLSNHSKFSIIFTTSPSSSALQWLSPPQTSTKSFPFVYSHCQPSTVTTATATATANTPVNLNHTAKAAVTGGGNRQNRYVTALRNGCGRFLKPCCQPIHARSVFPCQDTPAARICYSALLNIPIHLSAVMAAKHVGRRRPVPGDPAILVDDSLWCSEGRVVEEFVMEQPVPPYLLAFAVGEIGHREVGPRTRVYAEAVPELLDGAAKEFAGTEEMIKNPRVAFLTPAVVKGDGSGGQVVAHELAHGWTGNLITNKTNEHVWLNEGFTTYAEWRIVEAIQGVDKAALNIGIGWRSLVEEMERFKDNMEFTKLKTNQDGVDPDHVYSPIPYEKGFQFLWCIERQIGRPAFDKFLKKYIATFKFQSIDTDMFLNFLKEHVHGIEIKIDLKLWTEGTGVPPDAKEPVSNIYTKIVSLANEFKLGRMPREDEVADWQEQEWELYLENIPKSVEASQKIVTYSPSTIWLDTHTKSLKSILKYGKAGDMFVFAMKVSALDAQYKLAESTNYDVKVAFLKLAILCGCRDYYTETEKTLKANGRILYLRPLYAALARHSGNGEEKLFALRVFSEARHGYHPIAQRVVESILSKHV